MAHVSPGCRGAIAERPDEDRFVGRGCRREGDRTPSFEDVRDDLGDDLGRFEIDDDFDHQLRGIGPLFVGDGERNDVLAGLAPRVRDVGPAGGRAVTELPEPGRWFSRTAIGERHLRADRHHAARGYEVGVRRNRGVGVDHRDREADAVLDITRSHRQGHGVGARLVPRFLGRRALCGGAVTEVPEPRDRIPQRLIDELHRLANRDRARAEREIRDQTQGRFRLSRHFFVGFLLDRVPKLSGQDRGVERSQTGIGGIDLRAVERRGAVIAEHGLETDTVALGRVDDSHDAGWIEQGDE